MSAHERLLIWLLRIIGTFSLLAVVAVVMPYAWMNEVHRHLGLGDLATQPVVGYLARSTSLFYVLLGALLWRLSLEVRRFLPLVNFLGLCFIVMGATLLVVDWAEGLPLFWKAGEGLIDMGFGVVIRWLGGRLAAGD